LYKDISNYGGVETDYFDINSILNSINLDLPDGQDLNEPLSRILAKWGKTSDDFGQALNEFNIYGNRKINNDASLSFYVYANPFTEVPDGWYTKKIFNPNAKVFGFAYSINISNRNSQKINKLIDAFKKSLTTYHLDQSLPTDIGTVYRNDKQSILVGDGSNNSLTVNIIANSFLDSIYHKPQQPLNTLNTPDQ
jgi:hypothetical protein